MSRIAFYGPIKVKRAPSSAFYFDSRARARGDKTLKPTSVHDKGRACAGGAHQKSIRRIKNVSQGAIKKESEREEDPRARRMEDVCLCV